MNLSKLAAGFGVVWCRNIFLGVACPRSVIVFFKPLFFGSSGCADTCCCFCVSLDVSTYVAPVRSFGIILCSSSIVLL